VVQGWQIQLRDTPGPCPPQWFCLGCGLGDLDATRRLKPRAERVAQCWHQAWAIHAARHRVSVALKDHPANLRAEQGLADTKENCAPDLPTRKAKITGGKAADPENGRIRRPCCQYVSR
jgi:hypothetical protein